MKKYPPSQEWTLEDKPVKFKEYLKAKGLSKVKYDSLNSQEKNIYRGIRQASHKVRVHGKFIESPLALEVKRYAKNNNVTVEEFVKKNSKVILTYMREKAVLLTMNESNITDKIIKAEKQGYRFILNNSSISKTELLLKIQEFANFLKSNTNMVTFIIKGYYKINKKTLSFNLPEISKMKEIYEQ